MRINYLQTYSPKYCCALIISKFKRSEYCVRLWSPYNHKVDVFSDKYHRFILTSINYRISEIYAYKRSCDVYFITQKMYKFLFEHMKKAQRNFFKNVFRKCE